MIKWLRSVVCMTPFCFIIQAKFIDLNGGGIKTKLHTNREARF